jgi:hypothetical protein
MHRGTVISLADGEGIVAVIVTDLAISDVDRCTCSVIGTNRDRTIVWCHGIHSPIAFAVLADAVLSCRNVIEAGVSVAVIADGAVAIQAEGEGWNGVDLVSVVVSRQWRLLCCFLGYYPELWR